MVSLGCVLIFRAVTSREGKMEAIIGRGKSFPSVWSLRTFCLITGASRGFGHRAAARFAAKLPDGSFVLLAARDSSALAGLKSTIEAESPNVRVRTWSTDLAELDETKVDGFLRDVFTEYSFTPKDFDQAVLVHNAASLGDVTRLTSQQASVADLDSYWKLNLTSMVVLNSVFWKKFEASDVRQRVAINISSICAKQPLRSWAIYCAGKAARHMLFSTMALEEPSMRVLSYAPGPLDTQMQLEARTNTADVELKTMFNNLHVEGRLLSCDQSLDRLIGLLDKNVFDSGAHIDFYDLTEEGELNTI